MKLVPAPGFGTVPQAPLALTEKSWVVCLLSLWDGDETRVNMIWALWMFEKPRPLTFRGIPPLQRAYH